MRDWRECTLGEVVTFQRGFDITQASQNEGPYPVVSSSGIRSFHSEYKVKAPGVVIGRKGTLGTVFFLRSDYWPHDTTLWIKDFHGNDPVFIYYLLKTFDFKNFDVGSSNPTLNRNHIHLLATSIPPLLEQCAISEVLTSFDDKIDLLHRQNKTLEVMAETLFRQYFVKEVDEKWKEKSLLGFIDLIGGGTPNTDVAEYWDGNIPWLSGGDIAVHHKSFIKTTQKSITESGIENSSAKVLPMFSTVISARGTVGKYCLLAEPMAFSQSNYGILPRINDTFFFTYLLISHVVEELQASAYGSVFDTITTNTFRDIKVCMPEDSAIEAFETSIMPYFSKMLQNENQISSLRDLRDTLLPKLMSGEVKVEI